MSGISLNNGQVNPLVGLKLDYAQLITLTKKQDQEANAEERMRPKKLAIK